MVHWGAYWIISLGFEAPTLRQKRLYPSVTDSSKDVSWAVVSTTSRYHRADVRGNVLLLEPLLTV